STETPTATLILMMMYQPLPGPDYLRVIKLEPGLEDDILSCKLETVSLDGSLDLYEAISYVWGDPTATEEICCNGLFVEITSGLADALRRFRYPDKQRLLWADALCINQQDNQEKSRQVKQMGRIYENAKGVLVWVGRDSQGFAEACFRLLQEMNRYLDEVFIECESKMVDMPLLTAPYPICDDPEQWIKVQELLDLPWFERVWTIQEAALAKECQLCWGAHSIDIADIFEFVIWRHYKCTDPRDRIYAFLGNPLARFNQQPILDTNYDAPMDEILMHTASALIQHPREGSWLLSQVEHVSLDDLRLRKMPSWVPRWAKSLYTLNASTMFWYEAAGTGSTFSPSILEGNVLQVEGFVFDKIVWTSELIEGDEFTLTPEIRKRRVHAAGEPFIDLLYADVS
ncbi:heterokaryon incompatibility protein-domain-containing protein, partial [Massariosphaeria phaeospora]